MNAISPLPVDRRAERTHLFLVATLSFGRASTPVRVRNLSATGALVEGTSLPPVGSAIVLRRGALEEPGTIVWSAAGKAGLTFGGLVDVQAWLPTKEAKRQTQVDETAFGLKHAARVVEAATPGVADEAMAMETVVAELVTVQAHLDELGGQLALDAALLAKHPEVQLLDIAGQRIARIIKALRTVKG
ncbi:MAG: PilZ domain-containing protein [Sphingomonas bacterium]|nr:PilZ domain-containing protein [Sphingomonas bacterium]